MMAEITDDNRMAAASTPEVTRKTDEDSVGECGKEGDPFSEVDPKTPDTVDSQKIPFAEDETKQEEAAVDGGEQETQGIEPQGHEEPGETEPRELEEQQGNEETRDETAEEGESAQIKVGSDQPGDAEEHAHPEETKPDETNVSVDRDIETAAEGDTTAVEGDATIETTVETDAPVDIAVEGEAMIETAGEGDATVETAVEGDTIEGGTLIETGAQGEAEIEAAAEVEAEIEAAAEGEAEIEAAAEGKAEIEAVAEGEAEIETVAEGEAEIEAAAEGEAEVEIVAEGKGEIETVEREVEVEAPEREIEIEANDEKLEIEAAVEEATESTPETKTGVEGETETEAVLGSEITAGVVGETVNLGSPESNIDDIKLTDTAAQKGELERGDGDDEYAEGEWEGGPEPGFVPDVDDDEDDLAGATPQKVSEVIVEKNKSLSRRSASQLDSTYQVSKGSNVARGASKGDLSGTNRPLYVKEGGRVKKLVSKHKGKPTCFESKPLPSSADTGTMMAPIACIGTEKIEFESTPKQLKVSASALRDTNEIKVVIGPTEFVSPARRSTADAGASIAAPVSPRGVSQIFESKAAPSRASASALTPLPPSPRSAKTEFVSQPKVAQVDATAMNSSNLLSPADLSTLGTTKHSVFMSARSPSTADAGANFVSSSTVSNLLVNKPSVFEKRPSISVADAVAGQDQPSRAQMLETEFVSRPLKSSATFRSCDSNTSTTVSSNAPTIFTSVVKGSTADVSSTSPEKEPDMNARQVFVKEPMPSTASASALAPAPAPVVVYGEFTNKPVKRPSTEGEPALKQSRTVFMSIPTANPNVSASANTPATVNPSQSVFVSRPSKSQADASANANDSDSEFTYETYDGSDELEGKVYDADAPESDDD